jgi:hypothetical protein
MVTVASFYAPRLGHPKHIYDYLSCLGVQRQSCERFGARQIVITDRDVGLVADHRALVSFEADLPHDLMPAILAGQLALLESGIVADDLLLIGADGLLGHDPAELFDGSFDLAVTTHPFADCILNTGLIAVPAGKAMTVAPIWRAALARCGSVWGDDQLALAEILRPTLAHGVEDRDGLRVRFLPVPRYNEAPDHVAHEIDSLVVHFRGPRKVWMRQWAQRHQARAA